jgi:hypothetical protein
MIKQDVQNLSVAVRALKLGDKELAATYLYTARTKTRSRHIKDLTYALSDLHNLAPYIEALRKERKEWEKRQAEVAP